MKRPIILGSSLTKVPYRSSPLGQHLELLFVFLQYMFELLVCLAVNGLETYVLVRSVARDTSFMLYTLLSRFAISFRRPVAKVFLAQKSSKLILLIILGGPKLYRKLEFQFGVLTFPLSCLWKTQISLQIFETPLSGHAECYCPIFEPSMLIFEVRGARAVRFGCKRCGCVPLGGEYVGRDQTRRWYF